MIRRFSCFAPLQQENNVEARTSIIMPEKSIGIMNEAYFVGRKELLAWLNSFFQLNYDKIEQVCTGAAHCQIMDALYPGQVPLSKVNFYAKYDYEYIKNYKILQGVFNKLNISKVIDVNRLIKGKYQDNLEFLQWMKRFFDTQYDGSEYDAVGRRKAAMKEYDGQRSLSAQSGNVVVSKASSLPPTGLQQQQQTFNTNNITRRNVPNSVTSGSVTKGPVYRVPQHQQTDETSTKKIRQLGLQNTELRQEVENLERERDFYFQKLRDVEVLCQEFENGVPSKSADAVDMIEKIKKLLYATEEDFVVLADNTSSAVVDGMTDEI
jgi:RP/EB family microtubule-associated protein